MMFYYKSYGMLVSVGTYGSGLGSTLVPGNNVSVNGTLSNLLDVTSGVSQGSILGPLLFLVFINDLPTCVKSSKVLLFADDAKCYQLAKDYFSLQADLDSLYLWSLSNLEFNSGKVCHLCFHRNGVNTGGIAGSYGTYYFGDRPVNRCSSQHDLGVLLSDDLSWSNHYTHCLQGT